MSSLVSCALVNLLEGRIPELAFRGTPDPVGGMNFFCGLFQAVKIASLLTGNVEGVLVGAIGGGLACGMGW